MLFNSRTGTPVCGDGSGRVPPPCTEQILQLHVRGCSQDYSFGKRVSFVTCCFTAGHKKCGNAAKPSSSNCCSRELCCLSAWSLGSCWLQKPSELFSSLFLPGAGPGPHPSGSMQGAAAAQGRLQPCAERSIFLGFRK